MHASLSPMSSFSLFTSFSFPIPLPRLHLLHLINFIFSPWRSSRHSHFGGIFGMMSHDESGSSTTQFLVRAPLRDFSPNNRQEDVVILCHFARVLVSFFFHCILLILLEFCPIALAPWRHKNRNSHARSSAWASKEGPHSPSEARSSLYHHLPVLLLRLTCTLYLSLISIVLYSWQQTPMHRSQRSPLKT